VLGIERLERELPETVSVEPAGSLADVPGAQIGVRPVEEEQDDGFELRELEQLLAELERRLVREVQVLEHEAERALTRECTEELGHGVVRLPLDGVASERPQPLSGVVFEHKAEQGREEGVALLGPLSEQGGEPRLQLEPYSGLGVGDAELENAAEELPERVVGNVLRVGDALHPEEERFVLPARTDFAGQTALADPGFTRDRDDRPAALRQVAEHVVESGELLLATDQRRRAPLGCFAVARDAKRLDRFALSLQLQLAQRLEREQLLDVTCGCRADSDSGRPGVLLKTSGDVDSIAEGVVALLGRRVVGQEDDGARVDADAGSKLDPVPLPHLARVLGKRLLDGERRPHGTLGVVLVRARNAEERIQAVAGQLGDSAAEALDLSRDQPHDLVEEELRPLGAELLGDRGRARDVGQQDRDDAPLAGGCGHGAIMSAVNASKRVAACLRNAQAPRTGCFPRATRGSPRHGGKSARARPHVLRAGS
jgi:hypothetical protein